MIRPPQKCRLATTRASLFAGTSVAMLLTSEGLARADS